ncbi:putative RDD family membrane protein YckC [Dysgonomonas hofstadii]|uniref:Putative RDD family membrane protein YckC n=1 Tax=Dysgonomonas hofstadii TaxID=637886 RepID=A0A840CX82_9BACT|nr:RDD family protein [Dysgonomonas hofstadii]MBB4037375.1 putative RDD family membrane protein YckC [Dysgonomonas hofstadii]
MENKFDQEMFRKTNTELIKIVTIDREDYQLLAIEAAENELKKRNISDFEIESTKQKTLEDKIRNIKIEKNTVNPGIRFFNFIIDSLVWLIIAFIFTFPLNANNNGQMLIGYIVMLGTYIGYYFFLETKFQQTLGKMLTKTKVVKYNEEKPSTADILARTLLRIIAPFDLISFLFTRNGLHDKLSHTKVIKVGSNQKTMVI